MVQQQIQANNNGKLVDLKLPFPWKLHKLLEETEERNTVDIISWQPDGASFKVHKPKAFTEEIMPSYFSQTKFNSFRRQCYIYGFRLRRDGAFHHPEFRRDNLEGSLALRRNQQEDRRRKMITKKNMLNKKPLHESNTFKLPPPPSCMKVPRALSKSIEESRKSKVALSLFEQTFYPSEGVVTPDVPPKEVISFLADSIFENSQFNSYEFDEFLSLDGTFKDIPLDSLNEVFLSEISENPVEQRHIGYTGALIQL